MSKMLLYRHNNNKKQNERNRESRNQNNSDLEWIYRYIYVYAQKHAHIWDCIVYRCTLCGPRTHGITGCWIVIWHICAMNIYKYGWMLNGHVYRRVLKRDKIAPSIVSCFVVHFGTAQAACNACAYQGFPFLMIVY